MAQGTASVSLDVTGPCCSTEHGSTGMLLFSGLCSSPASAVKHSCSLPGQGLAPSLQGALLGPYSWCHAVEKQTASPWFTGPVFLTFHWQLPMVREKALAHLPFTKLSVFALSQLLSFAKGPRLCMVVLFSSTALLHKGQKPLLSFLPCSTSPPLLLLSHAAS